MNSADCLGGGKDDAAGGVGEMVGSETPKSWQELLIELVKARPCLYDPAHRDSTADRNVHWAAIADELQKAGFSSIKNVETDAETTRKKWESFRDSYRKFAIQVERGTRTTAYLYADQLSFLRPLISSSITATPEVEKSISDAEDHSYAPKIDQTATSNPSQPRLRRIAPALGSIDAKKRKVSMPPVIANVTSNSQSFSNTSKPDIKTVKKECKPRDPDYNFCQVIIDKLREIPEGKSKDKLKLAILQQIIETKYQS